MGRAAPHGDPGPTTVPGDGPTTETTSLGARLERRVAELTILHEIGHALQSATDLDRISYAVLIGATAHTGLKFHRAFLLLVDRETDTLRGAAAVGPADAVAAARIWGALRADDDSLAGMLDRLRVGNGPRDEEVRAIVFGISVPLASDRFLARTLRGRRTLVVRDGREVPDGRAVDDDLLARLGTRDLVAAPLVADDEPVGLLLADHVFSPDGFVEAEVQLLDLLAGLAATAIRRTGLIEALRERSRALEQAGREIEENQRRLLRAERLTALGQMAARVAHEFRTPLTVIGGFARSLLERSSPGTRESETLEIMVDEVRRLETIVNSVLEHAHEPRPDLRAVDVGKLAAQACDLLRHQFDRAGIAARIDVAPGTPPALADRDQLFQALINLLHNAIHAMPDGGELRVRARGTGARIELEIEDEGVGIPRELLGRVTEPFFTTRPGGTGLGLPVVAGIARGHGGEMLIDSREGVGTRVVLRLQATHGPAGEPADGGQASAR